MREILFRGKRLDNGKWVYGYYTGPFKMSDDHEICDVNDIVCSRVDVDSTTVGQFTNMVDKHGEKIFEGDITELILPEGEVRRFVVKNTSVVRDIVNYWDFDGETSKVGITGTIFQWGMYQLFPCIGGDGIPDNEKMTIIGNIHDHPDLVRHP